MNRFVAGQTIAGMAGGGQIARPCLAQSLSQAAWGRKYTASPAAPAPPVRRADSPGRGSAAVAPSIPRRNRFPLRSCACELFAQRGARSRVRGPWPQRTGDFQAKSRFRFPCPQRTPGGFVRRISSNQNCMPTKSWYSDTISNRSTADQSNWPGGLNQAPSHEPPSTKLLSGIWT